MASMLMVVRLLVMTGVVVAVLAVGMDVVTVVMASLAAMGMGMLVAVMVRVEMGVLVGVDVHLSPVAVGMLVGVMVRMLMIVAVGVLSFHGALLVSHGGYAFTHEAIVQQLDFIVNTVPRILFCGALRMPVCKKQVSAAETFPGVLC